MKRIKMGIMALAAITGIGGAFAFNYPHKAAGTLYYGQGTASSFRWVAVQPSTSCVDKSADGACTITSTYDVTGAAFNNELPPGAHIQNGSGALYNN